MTQIGGTPKTEQSFRIDFKRLHDSTQDNQAKPGGASNKEEFQFSNMWSGRSGYSIIPNLSLPPSSKDFLDSFEKFSKQREALESLEEPFYLKFFDILLKSSLLKSSKMVTSEALQTRSEALIEQLTNLSTSTQTQQARIRSFEEKSILLATPTSKIVEMEIDNEDMTTEIEKLEEELKSSKKSFNQILDESNILETKLKILDSELRNTESQSKSLEHKIQDKELLVPDLETRLISASKQLQSQKTALLDVESTLADLAEKELAIVTERAGVEAEMQAARIEISRKSKILKEKVEELEEKEEHLIRLKKQTEMEPRFLETELDEKIRQLKKTEYELSERKTELEILESRISSKGRELGLKRSQLKKMELECKGSLLRYEKLLQERIGVDARLAEVVQKNIYYKAEIEKLDVGSGLESNEVGVGSESGLREYFRTGSSGSSRLGGSGEYVAVDRVQRIDISPGGYKSGGVGSREGVNQPEKAPGSTGGGLLVKKLFVKNSEIQSEESQSKAASLTPRGLGLPERVIRESPVTVSKKMLFKSNTMTEPPKRHNFETNTVQGDNEGYRNDGEAGRVKVENIELISAQIEDLSSKLDLILVMNKNKQQGLNSGQSSPARSEEGRMERLRSSDLQFLDFESSSNIMGNKDSTSRNNSNSPSSVRNSLLEESRISQGLVEKDYNEISEKLAEIKSTMVEMSQKIAANQAPDTSEIKEIIYSSLNQAAGESGDKAKEEYFEEVKATLIEIIEQREAQAQEEWRLRAIETISVGDLLFKTSAQLINCLVDVLTGDILFMVIRTHIMK